MHSVTSVEKTLPGSSTSKMLPKLVITILAFLALVNETYESQDLAIDCPAYIGNLHDEVAIISKFRTDFDSGRVKSVHHK